MGIWEYRRKEGGEGEVVKRDILWCNFERFDEHIWKPKAKSARSERWAVSNGRQERAQMILSSIFYSRLRYSVSVSSMEEYAIEQHQGLDGCMNDWRISYIITAVLSIHKVCILFIRIICSVLSKYYGIADHDLPKRFRTSWNAISLTPQFIYLVYWGFRLIYFGCIYVHIQHTYTSPDTCLMHMATLILFWHSPLILWYIWFGLFHNVAVFMAVFFFSFRYNRTLNFWNTSKALTHTTTPYTFTPRRDRIFSFLLFFCLEIVCMFILLSHDEISPFCNSNRFYSTFFF